MYSLEDKEISKTEGDLLKNNSFWTDVKVLSGSYAVDFGLLMKNSEIEKEIAPEKYVELCLESVSLSDRDLNNSVLAKYPFEKREEIEILAKLNSKGEVVDENNIVRKISLVELISEVYPSLFKKISSKENIKSTDYLRTFSFLLLFLTLASCSLKKFETEKKQNDLSTNSLNSAKVVYNLTEEELKHFSENYDDNTSIRTKSKNEDFVLQDKITGVDVGQELKEGRSLDYLVEGDSGHLSEILAESLNSDNSDNSFSEEIMVSELVPRIVTEEEKNFLLENEIYTGDKEREVILLTYDDGGRREYIEHLMQIYERYDSKTTFFVTGEWVKANQDLTKEIITRGFEVGCHGWDHAEMTSLGREKAKKQFNDFLDIMEEVDPRYKIKLVRFPYGSRNEIVKEVAAELGLQSVMWNVESGGNDEKTFSYVTGSVKPGNIILSHSTRWYDVYESEKILKHFKDLGYDLVTVTEGMSPENVYNKE